jgi:uncharacterized membrane protein
VNGNRQRSGHSARQQELVLDEGPRAPWNGASIIGKALGVLGAGVFVVAFAVELTEVLERRRAARRARAAEWKARAARVLGIPRGAARQGVDGSESDSQG